MDSEKSVGKLLYDDGEIDFSGELLIGLIQALLMISRNMGSSKGSLREAELDKYDIAILTQDHLAYVSVHDKYDSEPFNRKILDRIIDLYHDSFRSMNLNLGIQNYDAIRQNLARVIQTMKFPKDLLYLVDEKVTRFIQGTTDSYVDTLFLTDLDDGIIKIYREPDNKRIIPILLEIISEIPFERPLWFGYQPNFIQVDEGPPRYEGWFIHRIGQTEFFMVGKGYYTNGERERLLSLLDQVCIDINTILKEDNRIFDLGY